MNDEQKQSAYEIATETLGKDLLGIILQEVKVLPDVWQKLSEYQQNEVIGRMRATVEDSIKTAVYLIATEGFPRVRGELKKITMADKKEAVISIGYNDIESLHALYESVGDSLYMVMADESQFTGAMDQVKGEKDQRDAFDEFADDVLAAEEQFSEQTSEELTQGLAEAVPLDDDISKAPDDSEFFDEELAHVEETHDAEEVLEDVEADSVFE